MGNGARALIEAGTALWLDGASRAELRSGELAALIADQGVTGATTNPVAVQEALGQGVYDEHLGRLAASGATADEAVRALLVEDATVAADLLRPAFDESGGRDGYVTVSLPPWAVSSTAQMVSEAREVADALGRPNVLVGVPATPDGVAAVAELVAAGIGVNVTPTFSTGQYRAAVEAHRTGLEKAAADGKGAAAGPVVVSVVVNQVDTEVDKLLWRVGTDESAALRGTAAVANARLVYAAHAEVAASAGLAAAGGQGRGAPGLAWTAMAVRDPYYADTHYVDALVAEGVTATLPAATLGATAAGNPAAEAAGDWAGAAEATVAALAAVGVSVAEVVASLERTGLPRQDHAWGAVREAVAGRLTAG